MSALPGCVSVFILSVSAAVVYLIYAGYFCSAVRLLSQWRTL